ncbi:MAG: acireductone synthase [Pirellulaceae bacterium]
MLRFAGRAILLDIEGTTSSVSFVYDYMFPYVRRELGGYLRGHWQDAELAAAREALARDAGAASWAAWSAGRDESGARALVTDEVERLMAMDAKRTGLKQLQGLIWEAGFRSGELQAHVYADVPPALAAWRQRGLTLAIYSSGSVHAQRLFFGHTIYGDLLPHFRAHYDTTVGGKKEAESYSRIARDLQQAPAELLFVSDVPAELDAARQAGLLTALCVRPGNAPVDAGSHPVVTDFGEVVFVDAG